MKKILLLSALVLTGQSYARMSTLTDAPISVLDSITYEVEKDGSSHFSIHEKVKVLNEQGRSEFGTLHFDYSPEIAKVKNLKAKTINKDGETGVRKDQISDKAIAVDNTMFDSKHRVTLSFPKVEVGSELHLSWEEDIKPSAFGRHFFYTLTHLPFPYLEGSSMRFVSKVPLYVDYNRPDIFEVKESMEGALKVIDIKVKKTFSNTYVQEDFGGFPDERRPMLFVSTAKSYDEVLKEISAEYQKKIAQDLPSEFRPILDEARKEKDFFKQADIIMAGLAEKVRYMGDLRTVKGRFIARDLKEIAKSSYGDCKDYSSLTVAMLRKLSYDADIAFVERNNDGALKLPKIADPIIFNHAIVHVKHNGKSYWLDPTNPTSLSQLVRGDISNRESLILKKTGTELSFIPLNTVDESSIEKTIEYSFHEQGRVGLSSKTRYSGVYATGIRDYYFQQPHDALVHQMTVSRTQNYNVLKVSKVHIPPIDKRLPGAYEWSLDLEYKAPVIRTSMGEAFYVEPMMDRVVKVDAETYETGHYLGTPVSIYETMILRDKELGGKESRCKVQSKWLEFEREILPVKGNIEVRRTLKSYAFAIKNEEIKTPAFRKLQEDLSSCDGTYIVVFSE